MNHRLLAEIALSFLAAVQAVATMAIDFNRTHATNPRWPGHARFHVVWQSSTVVLLALVELVLIWQGGPYKEQQFDLAAVLAALSPLGFLAACTSRHLFGGTLSDPNGIRPARVRLFGSLWWRIDVNLAAVTAALLATLVIVWIFHA